MNYKSIAIILMTLVSLLSLGSCKETPRKQAIKTPEINFTKEGELTIYQSGTDAVLARLNIEIADNEYETSTGLMYRKGMANNQGMLFVFDELGMHSFYMKNTEFDIDILFIDEDLTIVHYHDRAEALDESGISSRFPVRYVLEINAGLRSQWGLDTGDRIDYKAL